MASVISNPLTGFGTPNYPDQGVGPALNPGVPSVSTLTKVVNTTLYNVAPGDQVILVTTGASNVIVNLPVVAANPGRRILIIKVDSGAGSVVVTPNGSDTIEGNATKTIGSQYGKVGVITDGIATWLDLGQGGV